MNEKIKLRNILGYSSINFLGSGAQGLMSAWLLLFYTTVCGLDPIKASSIFTIARLIDAVGNPVLGFISDGFGQTKLGRRFGRRKPFIALGIVGIAIIFPCLWIAGQSFSYYFAVNMIYEIAYTLIFVPGTTLPAEMTQNAAEKAKLIGGKQYCGTLSGFISGLITAYIFSTFGKATAQSYWYIGLSWGIITTIALLFFLFNVYERDPKTVVYEDAAGSLSEVFKKLGVDLVSCMRLKAFRLHSTMWFLGSVYKQLQGGVLTFFALYVLTLDTVNVSAVNSVSSGVSLVAVFIYIILAYKFGGPKTFKLGIGIIFVSLLGYVYLVFTGHNSFTFTLFFVFTVVNIVGKAAVDYVPTYQMGFVADIDEALTLKRREGIYNGINGLFGKLAAAIETSILGIGLAAFGFVSSSAKDKLVQQPPSAITGIAIVTIVFPIILLTITWFAASRYKLTKETHKLLVDEVNRIKAGGSMEDVTPEAKAAVEVLTGWQYEKCFGNNNVAYTNKSGGFNNTALN
ncbi:oligogalacturonide transporter [Clostridium saccharoperbutylacetonicum]|uniref:Na:galactoside symporter family permease n=1 Tax=Clostridium saccharoperbutylacetonicum N1-4(HMT) TaxID=931276 RepID=M1LVE0_9CLOT|nr:MULTISPECIES: MFS transporter [Clostridium]AGF57100.1 Na:galactoside symporter family permease [Clostridium saccharoperbutylacetonicum N1-4(HMT)]NRT62140.1 oligogalacturonide transporter [Clostridium saccharoperbutylacetonicum]NSB25470.1 oligogalacturonide transporter [Clostridium saccharoperbutylacetonicum]NSB44840.1 oligogalacturonide transporter [Clostridium saccharoperbutylacetonicum]